MNALEKLDESVLHALKECPAADVLSALTGALVGLAVEMVRRQGHDIRKQITLSCAAQRDVTISAAKEPSNAA